MRIVEFTHVRMRFVPASSIVKEDCDERYGERLFLDADKILWIRPVLPDDERHEIDIKGPKPMTEIGFSEEVSFQVVESLDQVIGIIG